MNKNGFTLIEILVVSTIIVLLSTIGMLGYQAAGKSARDTKRKADIEQIRSAVEIYKAENGVYPPDDGSTCDGVKTVISPYLNAYPTDTKSPTYQYCYNRTGSGAGLTYEVCAQMETGGSAITCTGTAVSCGTSGSCNYRVLNP